MLRGLSRTTRVIKQRKPLRVFSGDVDTPYKNGARILLGLGTAGIVFTLAYNRNRTSSVQVSQNNEVKEITKFKPFLDEEENIPLPDNDYQIEKIEEKIHEPKESDQENKETKPTIMDEDTPIFKEIFLDDKNGYTMNKISDHNESFISVAIAEGDNLILLRPPVGDKMLLEFLNKQIQGVVEDYKHKYGEGLKIHYINIQNRQNLIDISSYFGLKCDLAKGIPMFVIKNENIKQPTIITLQEIADNQKMIYSAFKKLDIVGKDKIAKFKSSLENIHESTFIVAQYYNPEDPGFEEAKSQFFQNIKNGPFSNARHSNHYFITEKEALSGIELQSGDFVVLKKTRVGGDVQLKNGEYLQVAKWAPDQTNLNLESISKELGEVLYKQNTFVQPDFYLQAKKYSVEVFIDKNKLRAWDITLINNMFKEIRAEFSMLNPSIADSTLFYLIPKSFRESQRRNIALRIRDVSSENDEFVQKLFENKDRKEFKEMLENNPDYFDDEKTHIYEFPENGPFNKDSIVGFLNAAVAGKIKQTIEHQTEPSYKRHTRKLIGGESFMKDIEETKGNQAVLFYTKHCGGCKKFSPLYEELAKKSIESLGTLFEEPIIFNRINNDYNKLKGTRNFFSTPIFALYKEGFKTNPLVYKGSIMTEQIMHDFFELSSLYRVVTNPVGLEERLSSTKNFNITI